MEVKSWRYYPDQEELVASWLIARGLDASMSEELPEIGFMAMVDGEYVAAGFIRTVGPGYGMIDSYITDPDADPEHRNAALDELTRALTEFARDIGLARLLAFSEDKNTIVRAERLGFQKLPHTVMSIDL